MVEHILKASQEQHKVVTIMYQGDNEITQRKIKVLDLYEDRVKAYCYLRHQPRVFRKDSILAADFCRKH